MLQRLLPLLLAAFLLASALGLVASQYRARLLFAEIENLEKEARGLDADAAGLRSELGRLGQPANVEAQARRLGMHPVSPDHIVALSVPLSLSQLPDAPARETR